MLSELTANGPRLSGSPQAAAAVELTRQMMERLGFDQIRLQPVMVPHWVRGPGEEAAIINSPTVGTVPLSICALGGSIGTSEMGVVAEVIEVKNFEEVHALGKKAAGKIIFFNRPKRTIRAVMFMNEENGLRGGIEYARAAAMAMMAYLLSEEF